MEIKRNLKYFTVVGLSVVLIIGLVVLALGVVGAMINQFRGIGIALIVLGLGIVVFGSGGKADDSDIDYACLQTIKELEEDAEKKFEIYERNFLKMIRPVHLKGFQFPEAQENFYCRKGADGKHRSNLFEGTCILFTNEKMYIYNRRCSVISEDDPENTATIVYYTKLDRVFIEEGEYTYIHGNKQYKLKTYQFVVVDLEGNEVLRTFIDYGADADKAVDDINHVFDVRKKAAAERAAEKAADLAARAAAAAAAQQQ